MYSRIIDPETNNEYGLNSTRGIAVLTNYISSLKDFTTKRQQLGGARRSMVLPDDDEFNVPLNMYQAQTRGVNNGDEPFVEESPEEEFSEEVTPEEVVPEEESPEEEFSEEVVPEEESPEEEFSEEVVPEEESPEEEFSEEVVPEEESPEEEFSEEVVPEEESPEEEFPEKPNTESTLEVPVPSVAMDSVVQDDFENGEESSSEDSDEYY